MPIARRYTWDSAKDFSEAVVKQLASTLPQRFVAKSGPRNRIGKIFVDYLRNARGATTATAFSARARPGLGVSMTIAREQLDEIEAGSQWNIVTALPFLAKRKKDPWSAYAKTANRLEAAAKRLGHSLK
jgi:bifunctional non-homologous end joining protein LigD